MYFHDHLRSHGCQMSEHGEKCQSEWSPLLFTGDQLINFMQPVLSVLALNQRENQPGIINIPQSLSKRADGHQSINRWFFLLRFIKKSSIWLSGGKVPSHVRGPFLQVCLSLSLAGRDTCPSLCCGFPHYTPQAHCGVIIPPL